MLLFKKPFFAGLQSGAITLTFRRWQKPHVRPGGRYRCHPIGVLEVDAVDLIRVSEIDEDAARRSGFESRDALLAYMRAGPGGPLRATTRVHRVALHHGGDGDRVAIALDETTSVYRVALHHGGDGDRVELALEATLAKADVAAIKAKLARLDRTTRWTAKTLAIIAKHPRVAASKLAAKLGRETLPFKIDVRKLKKLGLTQSFEVGYEISPRGRAYLAAIKR